MSHDVKNVVISLPTKPVNKSARQRKRQERARRKAAGQVAVTIHVDEKHRQAARIFETILNSSDALIVRLVRFLVILNDKLPERQRARQRAPKVTKKEARAAVLQFIKSTIKNNKAA